MILTRFIRARTGATAIEYALLAGLIAVAIIIGVTATGDSVKASYEDTAAQVAGAMGN